MNKLFWILNLVVVISCSFVLNTSINNLNKTTEQILKYKQPEQLKLLEEQYILAEE